MSKTHIRYNENIIDFNHTFSNDDDVGNDDEDDGRHDDNSDDGEKKAKLSLYQANCREAKTALFECKYYICWSNHE